MKREIFELNASAPRRAAELMTLAAWTARGSFFAFEERISFVRAEYITNREEDEMFLAAVWSFVAVDTAYGR